MSYLGAMELLLGSNTVHYNAGIRPGMGVVLRRTVIGFHESGVMER